MIQTLVTLCIQLTVISQWMSLLFIPGVFDALSNSRGFTALEMGSLQTMRLLCMFTSLPVWAWLSTAAERKVILGVGLLTSAIFTVLTPLATSFADVMLYNIMSGVFLGVVIPTTRSLVASYYPLKERGTQYGLIELSSGVGGFAGAGLAVAFKDNWENCFISVGILGVPCSLACLLLLPEDADKEEITQADLKRIFDSKVFKVQLFQGMFGAFPWAGMSFMMMWLEKMGIAGEQSVLVFASVGLGAALGGLWGGWLGDKVAQRWPETGRMRVAHFSMLSGIIWAPCLLQTIPYRAENWYQFLIVGGFMGLFISWPAANQSANLTDVFEEKLHPAVFGIQFWYEGTWSSISPLLIGFMNDIWFHGEELASPMFNTFGEAKQQRLLKGFADSLTIVCCWSWGVAQIGYLLMYRYYPRESLSLN